LTQNGGDHSRDNQDGRHDGVQLFPQNSPRAFPVALDQLVGAILLQTPRGLRAAPAAIRVDIQTLQ
jgi:hypothetical protein